MSRRRSWHFEKTAATLRFEGGFELTPIDNDLFSMDLKGNKEAPVKGTNEQMPTPPARERKIPATKINRKSSFGSKLMPILCAGSQCGRECSPRVASDSFTTVCN